MTAPTNLEHLIRTGSVAILETIGDAISIQDKDLRVVFQNKAHINLMGDHRGEYCYAAYQRNPEPCPGCHLLESFKDGKIHRRVNSTDRPGRGKLHVEIVSTPLFDAGGEIIGGIESVRDITDRIQLEERLVKQLAAIEASMDGIGILNRAGEYVYLNQAHASIYRYATPAEILGRPWQMLYDSAELERFQHEVMPHLKQHGTWQGEATGRRRDGTSFPQELSLSVTQDDGVVCVVRDVSARKEVENRIKELNLKLEQRAWNLETANRELESFSYTLSHDVRSYLSRISLAVETLQYDYAAGLDETARFLVHNIGESCDGIEQLIQAILQLSRVDKSELTLTEIDLSALAQEVANDLRSSHPARQVAFTVPPGLRARGDRNLVKILLVNLLGNAWKYTAQVAAPQVAFGCAEAEGRSIFFVRDNGAGFDMNEAENLFKPFGRLGNSTGYKGIGIGLATVQRIISAHGGKIWGQGEPGKGATFFFTLS